MHPSHHSVAMSANSTTPSTKRDAVSWLGRLKTDGRRELTVAMTHLSGRDGSADQVVAIRRRHLDAHQVARMQPLALDTHHAVDVRRVGLATRQQRDWGPRGRGRRR